MKWRLDAIKRQQKKNRLSEEEKDKIKEISDAIDNFFDQLHKKYGEELATINEKCITNCSLYSTEEGFLCIFEPEKYPCPLEDLMDLLDEIGEAEYFERKNIKYERKSKK